MGSLTILPEVTLLFLPKTSFPAPVAKGERTLNLTPQKPPPVYFLIQGSLSIITQLCFPNKESRRNWGSRPITKRCGQRKFVQEKKTGNLRKLQAP